MHSVGIHRSSSRVLVGSSATLPEPRDSGIWFDSDAIIDRRSNPLLAAKVSLGCLNRDMSQQELDLFQFAACSVAQTSARPTQVMRGQFWGSSALLVKAV
jgi:hypothetical protein